MLSGLDRIVLGKNIRSVRKEKKITLEELSKGICSIGKMSNIENGLTEIDDNTVKQIATKLGVAHNSLYKSETEDHKTIRDILEEAVHLNTFGLPEEALKLLERANEQYKDSIASSTSLQLSILYTEGLVYKELKNEFNAMTRFYQVVEIPANSQSDIVYHSKANHNLGELYADTTNFSQAIKHLEKAADVLQAHKLNVPWRIYYNLCVLNMSIRDYDRATVYFTFISHKNPRLDYVNSLLHLLSENFAGGMERLEYSRKGLLELKDHEMLIRSVIATIYFSSFSPTQYKERLENTLNFIETDLAHTRYSESIQIERMARMLQSIIAIALQSKDFERSSKYLDILFKFEDVHSYTSVRYISLLLKAMYLKDTDSEGKQKRMQLLNESLDLMNEQNIKNSHGFSILYELSLLEDENTTFAFKALQQMYSYTNIETLDLIQFEHFMPTILSLS